ncbi:unnamed protein product [Calypogeia fissa]
MGLKIGANSMTLAVSALALLLSSLVWIDVLVEAAYESRSELPCSRTDPLMDPIHEVHHGHDVVWQIPSDTKAVLIFTHGGTMSSLEYFDQGPNCEQCYGLPESRAVALEALRRRYAVIVVTVAATDGYDFNAPLVSDIVKKWMAGRVLDGLPIAIWAHSAGGSLATALIDRLPTQAMVLACAVGTLEVEEAADPQNFPPTLFAYMPKDQFYPDLNLSGRAMAVMAVLRSRGVEVASTELLPKPLSALFFTERILCISDEMSMAIYAAFDGAGWLDGSGYLTINPHTDDWESILLEANVLPFCQFGNRCLIAQVGQELKRAFALHSFTSDGNSVIFPWLDATIHTSSGVEEPTLKSSALTAKI